MSKEFDWQKITAVLTIISFLFTMNFYFGNPIGLPLKYQLVSYSLFPLPSGGSLDLPIFFFGLTTISFIIWVYLRRR